MKQELECLGLQELKSHMQAAESGCRRGGWASDGTEKEQGTAVWVWGQGQERSRASDGEPRAHGVPQSPASLWASWLLHHAGRLPPPLLASFLLPPVLE